MSLQHIQIGEVAEQTGLSLRTIRYYEEVGLVVPSARTPGGFRLYTASDVARLQMVKRMKPLDFSLEEMRDLLSTLDELDAGPADAARRGELVERVDMYRQAADERVRQLAEDLSSAEEFARDLRREMARRKRAIAGRVR